MTQLGKPKLPEIESIRSSLKRILSKHRIKLIDAQSVVTGKDFLMKIWKLVLGVPLGIAIIHREMPPQTLSNIFYELGMMHAYGKETLIIKTKGTRIPSDFVRTEYIEANSGFEKKLAGFLETFKGLSDYYESVSDQLENNPLLAIDYLRRAYLISENNALRIKARDIFQNAGLKGRAKNSVEMLLINF